MQMLVALIRLLLAAVFGIAGIGKLVDLQETRKGMKEFGLPDFLAGPAAMLLPVVELALALGLLPPASAWWAGASVLALLLVFISAITYHLLRGQQPNCHCFGQFYSEPVGRATLARNVALAVLALVVVVHGPEPAGENVFAWAVRFSASQQISLLAASGLFALVLAEGWLQLNLWQQNGRLLLRVEALEKRLAIAADAQVAPHGLPAGTRAPTFQLVDPYRKPLSLAELLAFGRPLLLVFIDPECGPCTALLPEVTQWQAVAAERLVIALISRGALSTNRTRLEQYGLQHWLVQKEHEIADLFGVQATPSAVVIQTDGTIGSPLVSGPDNIRRLVNEVLAAHPAVAPGATLPDFQLTDLHGRIYQRKDLDHQPTVFLFWNPGCGFCQQMLPDLQAWELQHADNETRLVLVSSGKLEENLEMGLRSLVLFDPANHLGEALGVQGTPSAVLVDADGRVAAPPSAGAARIWELVKGPPPA